jgi:F-type H+-transporting ATPase subunit gamma
MKALKRRITSVNNTQQIMKAMNLVAASKVQKYKSRMEAVKPLFDEAKGFLEQGVHADGASESIYFASRPAKNVVYVVMSGERGLCGSYNANILKEALAHMNDEGKGKNVQVVALGAKCKEYFVRRGKKVIADYAGVLENVSYSVAEDVAYSLIAKYGATDEAERVDEIYLVYTHFESLLSQTPSVVKLLPFEPSAGPSQKEIVYEPDVDTYLRKSVPVFLSMFVYGAMVEASVCEQASRMTSMDAAARNAGEIVDDLTLQYNRQRQSAITQEISEIVGGANAI